MRAIATTLPCIFIGFSFSVYSNTVFKKCLINNQEVKSVSIILEDNATFAARIKLKNGSAREFFLPCVFETHKVNQSTKIFAMDCRSADSNIVLALPAVQDKGLDYLNVYQGDRLIGSSSDCFKN